MSAGKVAAYRKTSWDFQMTMHDTMYSFHQQLRGRLGEDGPHWLQQAAEQRGFLKVESMCDLLCTVLESLCDAEMEE
jgi:hypothetical protein